MGEFQRSINPEEDLGILRCRDIDVSHVPDWRYEPSTPITQFGISPKTVLLDISPSSVYIPDEVVRLRNRIPDSAGFPGPFVNVDAIRDWSDGVTSIVASQTDFFMYLASAYHFREKQKENPVHPLSVQATLVTSDGMIVAERRSTQADFSRQLSVFGGALTPDESNPHEAIRNKLARKQKIEIEDDQVQVTGIGRENVNNVYCIFYKVELNPEQEDILGEQGYYFGDLEKRLSVNKRTLWHPLAQDNLLFAAVSMKLISPHYAREIYERRNKMFQERPYNYTYPIETYLT